MNLPAFLLGCTFLFVAVFGLLVLLCPAVVTGVAFSWLFTAECDQPLVPWLYGFMAIPVVVLLVMCLHQLSGNPGLESGLCKEAMLHCCLFGCGLAWAILGTYWTWHAEDCSQKLKEYADLAVVISWAGLPVMCCMYCALLCLSTAVLATSEAAESETFQSCQVQRPALRRGLVRQVMVAAFASQRSREGLKFCTVCRRRLLKLEAAGVDAGGESLCGGCARDEERHTLMSRQMEEQQRLQSEFEAAWRMQQEKLGDDLQQIGDGLRTQSPLEALDQLQDRLSAVHTAQRQEMTSLTRVEDQLDELRSEMATNRPVGLQQQVSELLNQQRARHAAERLRHVCAPPYKEVGSLQVSFVLWKMQSRQRVAFQQALAYRNRMADRGDLQAVLTAWRAASRPSAERQLDLELQDLTKLPAPEPMRQVDPLSRFAPPGRLFEDSPFSTRVGGSPPGPDPKQASSSDSEASQVHEHPPASAPADRKGSGAAAVGTQPQPAPTRKASGPSPAEDLHFDDTSNEEEDADDLPIEEIPEDIQVEDDGFGYGSRSLNPDVFRTAGVIHMDDDGFGDGSRSLNPDVFRHAGAAGASGSSTAKE